MTERPPAVPFSTALRYWVRLGFVNFGGPAGQIAMMHKDIVDTRRWVSEPQFLRALNFCMLLPGPEAQQLATYIGWRLHGVIGGLAAGLWFILPSIALLWLLSWLAAAYGHLGPVEGLLYGVGPVVIAIVAEAVLRLGRRFIRHRALILFPAAAFTALFVFHVPFPAVVLTAGLAATALGARWPRIFAPLASAGARAPSAEPPARLPPVLRLVLVSAVCFGLWLVPVTALIAWQGRDGLFARQALFFTGAAFVTFGGAYAVLSYVADAAVNTYGWLAAPQMVQGLALAESTPGPLIMVLQYVGFIAGWNAPGVLAPIVAATIGAITVTYVTFLPCFLFIFAGAPYVEALAGARRLQAAFSGITAAIVGVVLNLGVFFAAHVLFPRDAGLDVFAVAVAVAAFLTLWRLHWGAHTVVIAGALMGMAWVLGRRALGFDA